MVGGPGLAKKFNTKKLVHTDARNSELFLEKPKKSTQLFGGLVSLCPSSISLFLQRGRSGIKLSRSIQVISRIGSL